MNKQSIIKNVISVSVIFLASIVIIGCITRIFVRKEDYCIWNSFYGIEENSVDVPDVTGMDSDDAIQQLDYYGLDYIVVPDDNDGKNFVFSHQSVRYAD